MTSSPLHIETPLLRSLSLAQALPGEVWMKMEALQPSASFKLRGIGYACQHYAAEGAQRFVIASGGNAGIAVAYAGRRLGIPVTVVVPVTTTERAIAAIKLQEAEVIVTGETWQEAQDHALTLNEAGTIHLHPFDHPLLWTGHATLIDEITKAGLKPDAVVLSVGGGGLMCGVLEGLHRNNMAQVPVLAMETRGADSLAASLAAGRHVALERITSIATSLGAKKVADAAYAWCQQHEVISHVVSDQEALDACFRFADDHRLLVEPACGVSLSALYNPPPFLQDKQCILVIVCGGAGVSIAQLQSWRQKLAQS